MNSRTRRAMRTHVAAWSTMWTAVVLGPVLALGQTEDDREGKVFYLKKPTFRIPIQVDGRRASQIRELRLYVSTDQGATWQLGKTAPPTEKSFTFRESDGEYWVRLAVVDKQGRQDPPDLQAGPPDLKLLIDTTAPEIGLDPLPTVDGKAGVAWQIDDMALDTASLKLDVRGSTDGQWHEVPLFGREQGQTQWPIRTGETYSARLTATDRAGNVNVARIELPGEFAPSVQEAEAEVAAPMFPPAPPLPTSGRSGMVEDAAPRKLDLAASTAEEDVPVVFPAPSSDAVDQRWVRQPAGSQSRPARNPLAKEGSGGQGDNVVSATAREPIASSRAPVVQTGAKVPEAAHPAPPQQIPLVNSTRFAVNYQLRGVGPAGVGRVELYLTQDNGQTWEKYGEDPDRSPPFEVTLPGEGRYGLRVVVTSPAGYGQKPPRSGEAPQTLVEVDTTPPQAELYQPVPDPTVSDAMLLSWSVRDPHLVERPVGLFYAETADGPWEPIKIDLPATGHFSWRVPPRTPYQVFLRLVARDLGRNMSVADTPQPILVDLSRPEADVIGIAVLPDASLTR